MAWGCSSSDDSSDDSTDSSTVKIKTEPVRCKSEPSSESESDDESNILRNGHPHTSLLADWALTPPRRERSPIRSDRHCTLPRGGECRPIRSERHGTFSQGSHMPSTSNSATDRLHDIDYYNIDDFIPEATAMADGLTIQYPRGIAVIPYAQVPHRVIFTGPTSIAVQLPGSEEWIDIPGGIKMDDSIDRRGPTTTIIPYHYLKDGIIPPLPAITHLPTETIVDGVPRDFRIDSRPPAARIQSVPPAVPIVPPAVPIVPPAIPIVPRAVPLAIPIVPRAVPLAIPIVPPAVPIDNVPIKIKSEIISDDEDAADSLNMTFTNVAAEDDDDDEDNEDVDDDEDNEDVDDDEDNEDVDDDEDNEDVDDDKNNEDVDDDEDNEDVDDEDLIVTDDYDDIDLDILEAQVNLALQSIESNKKLAMKKFGSNKEPVVKRSESNEESFEEKCVPLVISSSEHFQKEICQKDSCDPTFGDGFEIDKIMNPKLRDDDTFLFEVQWRHENFAGIDVVEAPIIYDHWPDVALKFFQERYLEDKDQKKEKTD